MPSNPGKDYYLTMASEVGETHLAYDGSTYQGKIVRTPSYSGSYWVKKITKKKKKVKWKETRVRNSFSGIETDAEKIETLELRFSNSHLPPEIGLCKNLKRLELYFYDSTVVPPEIGNLTNLEELDIHFRGYFELPPEIGQLKNLKKLTFWSFNYKVPAVPKEFWELTQVTDLKLCADYMLEIPAGIGNFTKLESLWVRVQGVILPPEIGKLTKLKILIANDSRMPKLPAEIGQLTSLAKLELNDNRLQELPPEIGNLKQLKILDLTENELTQLPASIGQLTNLHSLLLNENKLTSLPEEIGNLTALTKLPLQYNLFTKLPAGIGKLTGLQQLNLTGSKLTSLPEEIGQLHDLNELILEGNKLTSLPAGVGGLTTLQSLQLNDHQLTHLPPEIGKLTNLILLELKGNRLETLPPEIGNLYNLQTLILDSNLLQTIPVTIGQLSNLRELDLNQNQLIAIPKEIGKLDSLEKLKISKNKLTSLPREIGNIDSLKHLYLKENRLTSLPNSIGNLSNLRRLYLKKNQLTTLPPSVGKLGQLRKLHLQNNQLKKLPKEIGRLDKLNELLVSRNKLVALPVEIENMTGLNRLSIKNNPLLVNDVTKENLWRNKIVAGLAKNNEIYLGDKLAEQYRYFLQDFYAHNLLQHVTSEHLIDLTNRKSAVVKLLAFKALENKKHPDLYTIALQHLTDKDSIASTFVDDDSYYLDWKDTLVADVFAGVNLPPKQRTKLDSIILYRYNNLGYANKVLAEMEPLPQHYERIKDLARKNANATKTLAKYKNPKDVQLIEMGILENPLLNVGIIEQFPHPYFKKTLDTLKNKYSRVDGIETAAAVYKDQFAVDFFNRFFNEKRKYYSQGRTILRAILKYKSPVYEELCIRLLEEDISRMDTNVFAYLQSINNAQLVQLAEKTLLEKDHFYLSNDTLMERCLSVLVEHDSTAAKQLVIKRLKTDGYYVYDGISNYSKKEKSPSFYVYPRNLRIYLDAAKKFKDTKLNEALFYRLKHAKKTEICVPIVECILSYKNSQLNQQLLTILAHKRTDFSTTLALKETLKKHDLFNDFQTAIKNRKQDHTGWWQIVRVKTGDSTSWKTPESFHNEALRKEDPKLKKHYFHLKFDSDGTYTKSFSTPWETGKYTLIEKGAFRLDTINNSGNLAYMVPALATDHSPFGGVLSYYADSKKLKLIEAEKEAAATYAQSLEKMLPAINGYSLKGEKLLLTTNGGGKIDMRLVSRDYPDWNKEPAPKPQPKEHIKLKFKVEERTILNVPDSIDGKPLNWYLKRTDIDEEAKLYIQGKIQLPEDHFEDHFTIRMVDSLQTENEATATFYLFLFHQILEQEEFYITQDVAKACARFFVRKPCLFFDRIKYGKYPSYYENWHGFLYYGGLWTCYRKNRKYRNPKRFRNGMKFKLNLDCSKYEKDWVELEYDMEQHTSEGEK
jgi:Leucine-rich repeat (LRR) protein